MIALCPDPERGRGRRGEKAATEPARSRGARGRGRRATAERCPRTALASRSKRLRRAKGLRTGARWRNRTASSQSARSTSAERRLHTESSRLVGERTISACLPSALPTAHLWCVVTGVSPVPGYAGCSCWQVVRLLAPRLIAASDGNLRRSESVSPYPPRAPSPAPLRARRMHRRRQPRTSVERARHRSRTASEPRSSPPSERSSCFPCVPSRAARGQPPGRLPPGRGACRTVFPPSHSLSPPGKGS